MSAAGKGKEGREEGSHASMAELNRCTSCVRCEVGGPSYSLYAFPDKALRTY